MLDMTFRVYLRWPEQKTTDKTTTEDPEVAKLAFDRLKERTDLYGQEVGIAFTQDNKRIEYFDFKSIDPNKKDFDHA